MESARLSDLMAITRLVREGRGRTRGSIGEQLSMRSSTVSDLVGELVARQLLLESTVKPKGRGRPATTLLFNERRFGAIFVSVVDRRLVAKVVDMGFHVLAERECEPPEDAGNAEMACALRALVEEVVAGLPADIEIATQVMSFSGLLDVPRAMWCVSSRWPGLNNMAVARAMDGLPWPVELVRNLDAELAGIRLDGRLPDDENVLLLHWGHGIGASFSADGVVVSRNRGRFCEIGHWGMGDARGRPCTCGNLDCLETVAALWALGPRLREAHPGLPLNEDALAAELRHLDLLGIAPMQEALSQVLRLTANLCRLLFPDRIILTGPFVQNPDIFHQFVEAIASAPLIQSLDKVRVSVSEVGQKDEITGALTAPFEAILERFLTGQETDRALP